MRRWKYLTKRVKANESFLSMGGKADVDEIEKLLNRYGTTGWELVNSIDTNTHLGGTSEILFIFKREIITDDNGSTSN